MNTKKIEQIKNMKSEYIPFSIYGIIRDFAEALIKLEKGITEVEKIVRNLSIEVNEHINK